MMKLTEALIPNSRWFVLVRQRKMVGGEKNLQEDIFLNQTRENGEPATLDPVLDDEELADDEDDSGHVADGEDAHHAGQNQSQVRLVPAFLSGSDVRVPKNEIYSAVFFSYIHP